MYISIYFKGGNVTNVQMNQCHYIRRTINDFPSVILKVSEICKNSSNVVLIEHSLQRQFSNTFTFTEMFVLIWSLLKNGKTIYH